MRVFPAAQLQAKCSCSRNSVENMLRSFSQSDRDDMVVLGSRGLGLVSRALQGSVSEHVATHAHATVVIAR